ncbi:MAG: IS66 family transposase, partial [Planctomycetales bacterium]|nr:IS66 family transposase [Planctomycetales bacterium]NIM56372.1 IS66 family transposase [Stutzerimonas stutzeri]
MQRKRPQPHAPEIVEMDTQQLEELINRVESNTLRAEDPALIRQVFDSYTQLFAMIGDKNTSLARLRKLLFGSSSEKTKDVVGDPPESATDGDSQGAPDAAGQDGEDSVLPQDISDEHHPDGDPNGESSWQPTGHGRNGAQDYPAAEQVEVAHQELAEGDPCPECEGGKLYEKVPGVLIRIVGQPPLQATVYRLQKLRCHLCGKVFTATAPQDAGGAKYDATAASLIALLKYGSGLPFNRLQRLQGNLGIPLPASTQWDVLWAIFPQISPAYQELIRQGAQGDVLYNDDTTVKILALMGERALQETIAEPQSTDRTGLFTSGVIATRDNRRIALFFSGRQHAGENLGDVLKLRAEALSAPIQMCDGLSRNLPKELETIVANCLAHARRQFVEIYDRFSDECRYVLEALKVVYHHDAVARQRKMTPPRRLQYHRVKSQQTMDRLHGWLKRQLDQKLVEPNSALGSAIQYMLKRWDALTLFLHQPGAPLDNNICERALKKAILHRKNSLFYKTQNGALVGDLFMSLIYTCELCAANPFDYLTQLQRNADQVAAQP